MAVIGIINGIDRIREELFNDGGVRILIGDGMLPKYGLEKNLLQLRDRALAETKCRDYQLAADPVITCSAARFRSSASEFTAPVSCRRNSMRWRRKAWSPHCPSRT